MGKLVVEVGLKLKGTLKHYDKILKEHGLKKVFSCKTRDIYFTKEKVFDGLTENQIKKACVRIRNPQKKDKEKIKDLARNGYVKVFDTKKKDFHYQNKTMRSRVQLQKIKKIGLLVYYDNPDYYDFDSDRQRELLINELNSYGFLFERDVLGIDKLRTLYFGKEMFSKNQNG